MLTLDVANPFFGQLGNFDQSFIINNILTKAAQFSRFWDNSLRTCGSSPPLPRLPPYDLLNPIFSSSVIWESTRVTWLARPWVCIFPPFILFFQFPQSAYLVWMLAEYDFENCFWFIFNCLLWKRKSSISRMFCVICLRFLNVFLLLTNF